MKYKANPMTLVSVESGGLVSKVDDHLVVETDPISQMDLENESPEEVADQRDVFVICLENISTGEQQNLALNQSDLIRLTQENLMHLSVAGDEVSQELCRMIQSLKPGDEECDEYDPT